MQNIIVIGCGSIGRRHMRNIRLLFPQAEICAIRSNPVNSECPPEADRLIKLHELDSAVSLAIVASPANYHIAHAKACVKMGIPTLIEKPLSDSFNDAKAFIVSLNCEQKRLLGVGYCLRYLPSARYMKSLLASNRLGALYNVHVEVGQYLPQWRPHTRYQDSVSANAQLGGGALNELSHEVDYLHWLFGIKKIQYATLRKSSELITDAEQLVDATLTLEDGIHSTLHLDFLQKAPHRCCTIIAQNGRVEWDLIDNSVTLFDEHGRHKLFEHRGYDKNQIYLDLVSDFKKATEANSSPSISIQHGLEVLQIIKRIKQAATYG